MHRFTIKLADYEGKKHVPESQEERINFLITKLREYRKRPAKEMQQLMQYFMKYSNNVKNTTLIIVVLR